METDAHRSLQAPSDLWEMVTVLMEDRVSEWLMLTRPGCIWLTSAATYDELGLDDPIEQGGRDPSPSLSF